MALYHYTDLAAVYSIIKNQTLWFTDIRFLNDSQELHDGISVLSEALSGPYQDLFSHPDYSENARNYLTDYLTGFNSYSASEDPLFVFSLSSEVDCLSQWRAYGSYIIEFDEIELASELSKIEKCVYSTAHKVQKARSKARDAISAVSQDMAKYDGCLAEKAIDAANSLILTATTFKHDGFSEEKESRIVLQSNDSEYPNNVKHRARGDILVPYLEAPITLNCIKSIMIGPIKDQNMAYLSMSEFIRKIEKNWQIDSGNIEYELLVNLSKIPFRA